jgi:hypothetical protein
MKKHYLLVAFAICSISLFSCKKESTDHVPYITEVGNDGGGGRETNPNCLPTTVSLIAGQNMTAGSVTVVNDDTYIYVTYNTAEGWVLTQTHLYVGQVAQLPMANNGNPKPGQFPYKTTHNNVTNFTYTIPLSALGTGGCGTIAAHAAVKQFDASGNTLLQTQTGWGAGTPITSGAGNWGTRFDYCVCL